MLQYKPLLSSKFSNWETTATLINVLFLIHVLKTWEWTQVDKGFVAQVADVTGGRTAPMNEEQKEEAVKTIKGEFSDVKHVRGILSMGR